MTVLTWRPDARQSLLLAAAIGTAPVDGALARWRQLVDVDSIDDASSELLPLVAHRLRDGGVSPPAAPDDLLGRLHGFRRRAFYANSIALGRLEVALGQLQSAGIDVVLGGGVAALQAYPDSSTRPLPDIELLVARGDAARAAVVLTDDGWHVDEHGVFRRQGCALTVVHRLRGTAPGIVDNVATVPSIATDVTGSERRALSPDVALVEIAVASVWPSPHPRARWFADLSLLASHIDHDAVVRHAEEHRASHLTRVALVEARRVGGAVPPALVRRLARQPASAFERDAVATRTGIGRRRFHLDRCRHAVGLLPHTAVTRCG